MANATTQAGRGQVQVASGINLLLGAWLIITPFVLGSSEPAMWNEIVLGFAVLLLAGTRVVRPVQSTKGVSWTNALIGIWLLFAPFTFGYVSDAAIRNDMIVGILLIAFASWSASQPRVKIRRTTSDMTASDNT